MVKRGISLKIVLGCGAAVVVLGLVVLSGWVFGIPVLVRIRPDWVPMVVNTAICFELSGVALLAVFLPRQYIRGTQLTLATLVAAFASVVLFQVISGLVGPWDLAALHRPLQPEYSRPGQMAPNTALGFILFGLGLILYHRPPRYRIWLRGTTFSVMAIGVAGVFGYFLKIDILYNWTGVVRMALHTGVGMSVLGLGLWHLWRAAAWNIDHSDQGEILRIHRVSTGLLILTASAAGVIGIALIQERIEKLMGDDLSRMVQDRRVMFEQIIAHRSERAAVMAENPALIHLLRQPGSDMHATQLALAAHTRRLQSHGFTAIEYEGLHGRWVGSQPLITSRTLT